jgi:(p)ppGpp synthase/HD superfamily hydrolase
MLDKAIELARKAHDGQVDKGGHSYINHPLRVMNNVETVEEKIVAVLHDAVEDSDLTLKDLRVAGFDNSIVNAIAKRGASRSLLLPKEKEKNGKITSQGSH